MRTRDSRRPGIALLLVLAMLFILDLLVFGLIAMATRERIIADAGVRWASTQFSSDAELRWARNHWAEVRKDTTARIRIDTAADGVFLLRDAGARGEAGLIVRTLPVRSLLASFPAAVATDGVLILGDDSAIDVADTADAACVRDSVLPRPGPGIHAEAHPPMVMPASRNHAQPTVVVGPLPSFRGAVLDTLSALAEHAAQGSLRLETALAGAPCDPVTAREWGNDLQAVRLCSDQWPLILIDGELSLAGDGRGVLLVRGTLRLLPYAQFTGAILLDGGRLIAARDSHVIGAIRGTNAGVIALAGASIRFDVCAVWTALRESNALNRPLPLQRTWIPVF